jgi:TonB family protein
VELLSNYELLHRPGIEYPIEAVRNGISGDVVLSISTDRSGEVTDARVVSGPVELRRAALQSVLGWRFDPRNASPSIEVTIRFDRSKALNPPAPFKPELGSLDQALAVRKIDVSALPEGLQHVVLSQIGIKEGDPITMSAVPELGRHASEIDSHLSVQIHRDTDGFMLIYRLGVVAPISPPTGAIRVGGNVQAANLLHRVPPVYPPLAKQARVQGTVRFSVILAKDGTVSNLQLVSGHPLLVPAATDAVKQWTYKPTLLNGQPVEVITQVDINFTLSDAPAPAPVQ